MRKPEPKEAGTWDFYGSCAPHKNSDGTWSNRMGETFTLRCFQWEPMARGKKTKRGKAQYRVKGSSHDPQEAFDKAEAFCAKKNAQEGEG